MYMLYLTLCAYDDHANPLARTDTTASSGRAA